MYEKTIFLCLMVQRYGEKLNSGNQFNESAYNFSKSRYLYFVSIFPARDKSNIDRR